MIKEQLFIPESLLIGNALNLNLQQFHKFPPVVLRGGCSDKLSLIRSHGRPHATKDSSDSSTHKRTNL